MLYKLFGCALVKDISFTMCANTNNIHIDLLIKMHYTLLHIGIFEHMRVIGFQTIQSGKRFHIFPNLFFIMFAFSGNDLQQMYP